LREQVSIKELCFEVQWNTQTHNSSKIQTNAESKHFAIADQTILFSKTSLELKKIKKIQRRVKTEPFQSKKSKAKEKEKKIHFY